MTPAADAIADLPPSAEAAGGVRLDDGEIVLLSLRQHWSVPAALGAAPSLLLLVSLVFLALPSSSPMPPALLGGLVGLAFAPLGVALVRHSLRRYLLTDRRVVVRHGQDVRWVTLSAVRAVESGAPDGKPGDVVFRSAQGVLVWPRVPNAAAAAAAAREAIERYAGG